MVRYVQAPSGKNCGLAGNHFTVLSLLATTALFSYMSKGEPSRIPSEVKQKRLSSFKPIVSVLHKYVVYKLRCC